jgi:pyruvate dehydrogenase E1 component alpha subunit
MRGGDALAASFFGDGALAEGIIHECLNIAALKAIPVLFVCENNGWSEFSPTSSQIVFTLERLSAAYGVEYHGIDGVDVETVAERAADCIATIRRERRPVVLECFTTRVRGHYEGDSQRYRNDPAPPVDPIAVARALLEGRGWASADLDDLAEAIRGEVLAAVETARLGTEATLSSAALEVYAWAESVG